MKLTEKQIADIHTHALAEYPRECCGIIERGEYVPLANIHETPETDFRLDSAVWCSHDVEAVVHSHPDAPDEPTASDMASQIETAVPWVLCSVSCGAVSTPYAWGTDGCVPPLIGRGFRHGPSGTDDKGDCYALLRDYYLLERGVVLPEFPRDNEWWKQGKDLYSDCFALAGFRDLGALDTPKPGDVVLMSIYGPVLTAAARYVRMYMVLHHLHGRLSRREPACLWRKMFRRWIRHEDGNTARTA